MDTNRFRRLICLGCGFLYDEMQGLPEHGLPAGTRWDDIPGEWECPDCGTPKAAFEMVALLYVDEASARQAEAPPRPPEPERFVLRDSERGFHQYLSTGESSSYIGGHPDAILSRHSSFNFDEYHDAGPQAGVDATRRLSLCTRGCSRMRRRCAAAPR
jgi:rubredoxin